ncbi:TPA: SseB family protein [Streptococcus pyogenes]|uniref:SseB family protein n=1 Tax=Streptococcus pyogenes TaxID=1314 RepID=UPI00109C049D|nr:SseB family protein [Streptococcus pyogenes]VHF89826.1 Galanin message associated peptide [Streptococcus pyogenes]HER6172676.1 SseB family protein [Streptococcus pyogenes]HER6175745.1 SseB family protein [Streptococcus pyogenes]HER6177605.1 SseB family protein [Streptococcus pyogenes]HER6184065.1 SseB family protein [Streptococcus pyogenes]
MTKSNELDIRLRAFINAPDNFLDSLALVNAFHNFPVWAAKEPYVIEVEGVKVTPVFTDKEDMARFKEEQKSAQSQYWLERSALAVLEEVITSGAAGLVFNLKKKGDFGNSTIFKSSDMIQFMNHYTTVLNTLMSDDNVAADTMEKVYLVPAFSNLQSFAKWYNQDDFGGLFRKAEGVILTWTIDDIYQPRNGENELDETFGVAINPFDDQQILVDWSELDKS